MSFMINLLIADFTINLFVDPHLACFQIFIQISVELILQAVEKKS
ncbi:hypothetical protein [Methanosarcina sp.]